MNRKFDYDFNMADKSFLNLSGYSSDNVRFFMILAEIRIALRNLQRANKGLVLAGLEFENEDYKENEKLSGYSLNKSWKDYKNTVNKIGQQFAIRKCFYSFGKRSFEYRRKS